MAEPIENTESVNSEQPVPATVASAPAQNPILLKGEIEIYPDQRLPHLDQGPVKAYAASGRGKEKAYALLCEKALVPQINGASKYLTLAHSSLPRLIGAGLVNWAPTKEQRYVFVYENKLGLPFANPSNVMAMGIKADTVYQGLLKKFVPMLKELRDLEFVHGNIRVSNLYTGGGNGFEKIMLGECLATPPAYLYSATYEPIERASALPLGRGTPSYTDDLYSFGVMLAVLMRTSDPLAGKSDEEIVAHKIEHGSYQALTGKERFSGTILELLRGLLNDDAKQRWTIDDIVVWLDGQRVSPKQASPLKPKAARPIEFIGEKYLRPQVLSLDFYKSPPTAQKLYDSGELKLWLNRSIQDKALEENAEHAINAAKELGMSGESYAERVAAFLSIAFGPGMPLNYKGVKFMPEAFGRLLAESFAYNKNLNIFAEILQTSMVNFWASMADTVSAESVEILNKFETCRAFLRQNSQGYGLERCLYYLCPEAPCMSEKLKDFYVRGPEELLLAYEYMANNGTRPERFFDRHIIAFLSVKDRVVIDPYIPDLSSSEPHRQIRGAIKVFSIIQRRGKLPSLPGVVEWICSGIDPLVNQLHDREQRAKLKSQIGKLKEKGEIDRVEQVFDNVQMLQADEAGFRQAMREYANYKNEYAETEHKLKNDPKFGYSEGRKTSALVSGCIAAIIILVYLVINMSSMKPF